MAVTIDSISKGRFGVNVITGWQMKEYAQMGIWPGEAHYQQRYEYCEEYVTIMKELWSTGHSDFKGQFFTMDDCKCSPLHLTARSHCVCRASDRATAQRQFRREYADFNFVSRQGINEPTKIAPSVARLVEATQKTGRKCGRPGPSP